jgi:hypothetical protein
MDSIHEGLYADMVPDPSISADEVIELAEMRRLMGDLRRFRIIFVCFKNLAVDS